MQIIVAKQQVGGRLTNGQHAASSGMQRGMKAPRSHVFSPLRQSPVPGRGRWMTGVAATEAAPGAKTTVKEAPVTGPSLTWSQVGHDLLSVIERESSVLSLESDKSMTRRVYSKAAATAKTALLSIAHAQVLRGEGEAKVALDRLTPMQLAGLLVVLTEMEEYQAVLDIAPLVIGKAGRLDPDCQLAYALGHCGVAKRTKANRNEIDVRCEHRKEAVGLLDIVKANPQAFELHAAVRSTLEGLQPGNQFVMPKDISPAAESTEASTPLESLLTLFEDQLIKFSALSGLVLAAAGAVAYWESTQNVKPVAVPTAAATATNVDRKVKVVEPVRVVSDLLSKDNAQKIVKEWQAMKAVLMAIDSKAPDAPNPTQILTGSALKDWRAKVKESPQDGSYWKYETRSVKIADMACGKSGSKEIVTLKASIEERATLMTSEGVAKDATAYQTTYDTDVELQQAVDGSWLISKMKIVT